MSDMWESVAPAWADQAAFVDEHLAAATERLVELAGVVEGAAVLEIACGPGGAGLVAARHTGPTGSVLLSDDAPGMVAAAGERAATLPHVDTALFTQTTIEADDDRFDAVISRHGLMFAEPPAAAVREAARVTRPGGRVAAMTWGPREDNPWLAATLDAVADEFGVPFPPPHIPGPFALDSEDALRAALTGGGLEDVTVERIDAPVTLGSVEEWWDRVHRLAGPLAIALAAMPDDQRTSIERRAMEKAEQAARAEGDGVTLGGCVLVGCGQAPR